MNPPEGSVGQIATQVVPGRWPLSVVPASSPATVMTCDGIEQGFGCPEHAGVQPDELWLVPDEPWPVPEVAVPVAPTVTLLSPAPVVPASEPELPTPPTELLTSDPELSSGIAGAR